MDIFIKFRYAKYGFILFLLLSVALFLPEFIGNKSEKFKKYYTSIKLDGIVIMKTINKKNRDERMIEIKNFTGELVTIAFARDDSSFFKIVEINDTLFKEKGSLSVKIKNKSKNIIVDEISSFYKRY